MIQQGSVIRSKKQLQHRVLRQPALSLHIPLSLSLPLALSLHIPLSRSHSRSLSFSIPFSLSLSLALSLSFSHSHSHSRSRSRYLSRGRSRPRHVPRGRSHGTAPVHGSDNRLRAAPVHAWSLVRHHAGDLECHTTRSPRGGESLRCVPERTADALTRPSGILVD